MPECKEDLGFDNPVKEWLVLKKRRRLQIPKVGVECIIHGVWYFGSLQQNSIVLLLLKLLDVVNPGMWMFIIPQRNCNFMEEVFGFPISFEESVAIGTVRRDLNRRVSDIPVLHKFDLAFIIYFDDRTVGLRLELLFDWLLCL
jgi:hypothetical protein